MKMRNKLILFIVIGFIFFQTSNVLAETRLNAYLFYGEGCPHCAAEEKALVEVQKKYPELYLSQFEVYHNKENVDLFKQVAQKVGVTANGVPFFVVGDKGFVGYHEGITIPQIESQINNCLSSGCSDNVASIIGIDASRFDKRRERDVDLIENKKENKFLEVGNLDLPLLSLSFFVVIFNNIYSWILFPILLIFI